jgi:hypothetical protein
MYLLFPSGPFPNEWVMRDGPKYNRGFACTIPRDLDLGILRSMNIPVAEDKCKGYLPAPHNLETYNKLMPKQKQNPFNSSDHRGLFAFQTTHPDGTITIKGAVQHRVTGKVALLTATNIKPTDVSKPKPSQVDGWWVYKANMIAPSCYWEAFKAC